MQYVSVHISMREVDAAPAVETDTASPTISLVRRSVAAEDVKYMLGLEMCSSEWKRDELGRAEEAPPE